MIKHPPILHLTTIWSLFRLTSVFLVFFIQGTNSSLAQISLTSSREKTALIKIQDKQWNEARELLENSFRKDSSSVETLYVLAIYFSSTSNPKYQPDSARTLVIRAQKNFISASDKEQEKIQRFPVNYEILGRLKDQIDRGALKIAIRKNSVEALTEFINQYPDARQLREVKLKRDSLAFESISKRNTAQSYEQYIKDWPESHLNDLAQERFDLLNFQERTRKGNASEFELFYNQFPESRYRDQALEKLFYLTTADGKEESFKSFAKKFPGTRFAMLSADLTNYQHIDYGNGLWIPVANRNKIGFINYEGKILIKPKFDSLNFDTACNTERIGLTILPDGIYDRNGRRILEGNFTSASVVGSGFILAAATDKKTFLLHESGWKPFSQPVGHAALIGKQFIAVRLSDKWQLSGLNGQEILPAVYDSIFQSGSYTVFKKSGKFQFVNTQDILEFKRGKSPVRVFDQVSRLGSNYLKVQIGAMEEALDEQLQSVIPLDRYQISYSPAGFIIEKNKNLYLNDWPEIRNQPFSKIEFPEPWIKTRSARGTGLYFLQDKTEATSSADSVWFSGKFAFAQKGDSVTLFTPVKQKVTFSREDELKFISSSDSGLFLLIRKRTQLQLFDALTGKKIVSGAYSEILPVTKEYFTVKLKNKTGLVQRGGKQLLAADYDAILYQNGWFSLLKDKRFGGFNPSSKKMLKPIYDANLVPFSDDLMIARKNKKWGILDLRQKVDKTSFIYEEVKYVNDSLALVRKTKSWSIINIYSGETIADQITDWQSVEGGERILYKTGSHYGLISPTTGILVQPKFREIIWLSDDHQNLYLGIEKLNDNTVSLEYFNRNGLTLQKFETSEEMLDLILCDN